MSIRLNDLTRKQLDELTERFTATQAAIVSTAIDRMFQQEIKPVKEIAVGETNDLHLYAVEANGRYFHLTESDLKFERPDAKIYYDSGIYPGVTDLPQYICDKASKQ